MDSSSTGRARRCTIDSCICWPDRAILDIRKIEDYSLNPAHPRGRHKARVFREALGLERGDAAWLRDVLIEAAREGEALQLATTRGEAGGILM
jgi:hypothetical protein